MHRVFETLGANSGISSEQFICTHTAIFTHRTSIDSKSSAGAIFSLELLDSLRGMPVPLAARTLGVSATAFKKACRRLGIARWQYRRGPGRSRKQRVDSLPSAKTLSLPNSLQENFDTKSQSTTVPTVPGAESGLTSASQADWEHGLMDLLGDRGEVESVATAAAPDEDALVLEMLALPWPPSAQ